MHLIFFNISYSSHKKMEHLDAFYNRELMCSGMMEMVFQLFSPRCEPIYSMGINITVNKDKMFNWDLILENATKINENNLINT